MALAPHPTATDPSRPAPRPAASCAQVPQLRSKGLERALLQQEMPLVPVLARMEHAGMTLDPGALRKEVRG